MRYRRFWLLPLWLGSSMVSRGTPSSRMSSLSRSNCRSRLALSPDPLYRCRYPCTVDRISCLVSPVSVASSARTRLKSRSSTGMRGGVTVISLRGDLTQDVHHEDQGGICGDRTVGGVAVAEFRRDDEQHLGADFLADQALKEALHH